MIKFGVLHFQNCFTIKVLLPRFFSTFKNSFSYGEGCLVLQSLVVFIVKSFLCVIHDENDPSKVDGSFNIIANVGLISLLSLCSVPYVPFLTFINSSNVFYLTGEQCEIFDTSSTFAVLKLIPPKRSLLVDELTSNMSPFLTRP